MGQACAFVRNAIIGHMLAKGDFGIAATLTMVLQLIESMTDVGAEPSGSTIANSSGLHTSRIRIRK